MASKPAYGKIKKYVFEHMDEHPKTTRKGLVKVFNRFNENTVARYRLIWLEQRGGNGVFKDGCKMLLNILKTKTTPKRELNKHERESIVKLEELING